MVKVNLEMDEEEDISNELKEALERNCELIDELRQANKMIKTSWYMMIFVGVLTVIITLRVMGLV